MARPHGTRTGLAAACAALACALPAAASAVTIQVNSTADDFAPVHCTLRAALAAANTDAPSGGCPAGVGPDTVVLPAGHYALTITGSNDTALAGDLDVTSAVTIEGAGAGSTRIVQVTADRVIDVEGSGNLTLAAVEVTGGRAPSGGAGPPATDSTAGGTGGTGADGGGIRNAGTLTVHDSLIDGNSAGNGGKGGDGAHQPAGPNPGQGGDSVGGPGGAGGSGGGIFSSGILTIETSAIEGNVAGDGGNGGKGDTGGDATGMGGNSLGGAGGAGGAGGGIATTSASTDVTASTIDGNRAGHGRLGGDAGTGGSAVNGGNATGGAGAVGGNGGGIAGPAAIDDATIYENHAGNGGTGGAGGTGGNGTIGLEGNSTSGGGGAGGNGAGASGAMLTYSTVATNTAGAGGEGGTIGTAGGGTVPVTPLQGGLGSDGDGGVAGGSLDRSIVASNVVPASQCTPAASSTSNVSFPDTSCVGAHGRNVDPELGPLADNGGPTETLAPSPTGSAVDFPLAGGGCPVADQRGVARPLGAGCDAGAYETGIAASTGAPDAVGQSSATLKGSLTPTLRATSFHFEYGPASGSYTSSTPTATAAAGVGPVTVSATIGGLAPSTMIHYRLVASSPEGTVAGGDQSFVTSAAPPLPPQQQQQHAPATAATLSGPLIIDAGGALAKLSRSGRFKLPGLRFECPVACKVNIVVTGGSAKSARSAKKPKKPPTFAAATLSVPAGKTLSATLSATPPLRALVKRKGYMRLRAQVRVSAAGSAVLTSSKSFVLTR